MTTNWDSTAVISMERKNFKMFGPEVKFNFFLNLTSLKELFLRKKKT